MSSSSKYEDQNHHHQLSHNHRNDFRILPDLFDLFQKELFCDIVVRVKKSKSGSTRIKAHRIVLASASSRLKEILSKNPTSKQLYIQANPDSFRSALNFMYSGTLRFTEKDSSDLKSIFSFLNMQKGVDLVNNSFYNNCDACEKQRRRRMDPLSLEILLSPEEMIKVNDQSWYDSEELDSEMDDEPMGSIGDRLWSDSSLSIMPDLYLKNEQEPGDDDDCFEEDEEDEIHNEDEDALDKEHENKLKLNKLKSPSRKSTRQRPHKRPSNVVTESTAKIRKVTGHLCSHCGRTLRGLTAYKRHLVIHNGVRPFSCDVCGKDFTQKQRLVVHQRQHTGERPYLCSLCGKTFTESCKLKRHLTKVHRANKDGSELVPGQPVIKAVKTLTSRKDNRTLMRKQPAK